ncbi:unnamed protein product [Ranitomeya imitator]|uniref:Protein Wnt n=1 Tax=Ranitomeya imitator TaxID=111125 RepID=A0ABN9M7D9_9NEOB|nr:unnamed protein product [Ranitomeya imitator]
MSQLLDSLWCNVTLVDGVRHDVPDVFNQIQVWEMGGPVHSFNAFILQKLLTHSSHMRNLSMSARGLELVDFNPDLVSFCEGFTIMLELAIFIVVLLAGSSGTQRERSSAPKFSPAERNYDVGNRELLAMKWAFEEWRHWLEGAKHRVVVLTDHKNLTYLESAKRLNPRQARSKNVKADALSRSFVPDSPGVPEPAGQVESSDCPGVDTVVDRLQQIWTHVVDNLTLSQEKAQRFANRRRCVGPRLRVGDLVWLSSRYVPMKVSSPKFKPRFIGPYKISEVLNPVSFRLTLSASFAIHNVFHRSLLRRYMAPVVPSVDPPAPVLVEGELEYVVEKILDFRISRRKLQYLVKWKGYGQEDNSWVFASDVHAADLVRAFHLARPGRPGGTACYFDFCLACWKLWDAEGAPPHRESMYFCHFQAEGSEPLTNSSRTSEVEGAAEKAHYKICDRLKLEKKQRRMCRRDPGVAETLMEAISMSAQECEYQFHFERWNCTLEGRYRASLLKQVRTPSFLPKGTSKCRVSQYGGLVFSLLAGADYNPHFYILPGTRRVIVAASDVRSAETRELWVEDPGDTGGFKETAFLFAISSAGLTHAMAKACSAGRMERCTCDEAPDLENREAWQWGGCGDNLKYSNKFVKEFLGKKSDRDLRARMDLHNTNVGMKLNIPTSIKRSSYDILCSPLTILIFE